MKAFYEVWVRIFDGDEEILREIIPWSIPGEIWDGTQDVVDFLQDLMIRQQASGVDGGRIQGHPVSQRAKGEVS